MGFRDKICFMFKMHFRMVIDKHELYSTAYGRFTTMCTSMRFVIIDEIFNLSNRKVIPSYTV